jgi:hypothetical protein
MISEFIRRCHYRESVSVLVEVDGELEPRELNHNQVRVIISAVLRIRIRDPVLFWPLDPESGSGMGNKSGSVIWVEHPRSFVRKL